LLQAGGARDCLSAADVNVRGVDGPPDNLPEFRRHVRAPWRLRNDVLTLQLKSSGGRIGYCGASDSQRDRSSNYFRFADYQDVAVLGDLASAVFAQRHLIVCCEERDLPSRILSIVKIGIRNPTARFFQRRRPSPRSEPCFAVVAAADVPTLLRQRRPRRASGLHRFRFHPPRRRHLVPLLHCAS
jgi:hypothetical protein